MIMSSQLLQIHIVYLPVALFPEKPSKVDLGLVKCIIIPCKETFKYITLNQEPGMYNRLLIFSLID